ncbi:winged helix-turn-helix domain-containing protein [Streptomyces sp. NBC_00063]|uniref:winged helix-turn-helix domain-containing protein n=1 Tax=Streptomyces sp. NBC_00063 TaxID=2975638 RepID=UPI00338EACF8
MALRSSGPAKRPKVSAEQFPLLETELLKGSPWPTDGRILGLPLSVRGVWELLRRHGWSCQQPSRTTSSRNSSGYGLGTATSFPPAPQGKPVQMSPDRAADPIAGIRRNA